MQTTAPEPAEDFFRDEEEIEDRPLVLSPVFSGEAFLANCCYPVVVEMWEKRKAGRVRRAYLAEFTETERNLIARWQTKFYRWHLVTGTPRRIMIRLKTLELLQRAVAFFGGV